MQSNSSTIQNAFSGTVLVDGTAVTAAVAFGAIFVSKETTITAWTLRNPKDAEDYLNKVLPAGMYIPIPRGGSSVTLTGQVQLIKT